MWEPKDFVSKTCIRDGAIVVEVRNLSHIINNRDSSLSLKTKIYQADFVNRFGPLTTPPYFLKIGFDGMPSSLMHLVEPHPIPMISTGGSCHRAGLLQVRE